MIIVSVANNLIKTKINKNLHIIVRRNKTDISHRAIPIYQQHFEARLQANEAAKIILQLHLFPRIMTTGIDCFHQA